jgi:hypothetical protein
MLSLLSLLCFTAPGQASRLSQPKSIEQFLLHSFGLGQAAEFHRAESLSEQRSAVQDGNCMIRLRVYDIQSLLYFSPKHERQHDHQHVASCTILLTDKHRTYLKIRLQAAKIPLNGIQAL